MSLLLGVPGFALLATQTASAQEQTAAPAATDPALQEAKAAFEEAQTLYTKEQFEDAAVKFMVAFDKKPFSSFLFNAAVANEKALQYQKGGTPIRTSNPRPM